MNLRKLLLAGLGGASALGLAAPAQAQDWYMGQILTTAANFCPRDTLEAQGQILSIAANTALFSLFGTTYGGNGVTTFALPDLRGRRPIDWGQGPGLNDYQLGQVGGTEQVTMILPQLPAHNHTGHLVASSGAPNSDDPTNAALADFPSAQVYNNNTAPNADMRFGTATIGISGGNQPLPVMNPFLVLRFCIVQYGIYPPQS